MQQMGITTLTTAFFFLAFSPLQCAVCSVQCAVCSVQCAVCSELRSRMVRVREVASLERLCLAGYQRLVEQLAEGLGEAVARGVGLEEQVTASSTIVYCLLSGGKSHCLMFYCLLCIDSLSIAWMDEQVTSSCTIVYCLEELVTAYRTIVYCLLTNCLPSVYWIEEQVTSSCTIVYCLEE